MKEEKELIYTEETEEIELLPPAWESMSEKQANSQPSSAPNGQRKLFSGLAIGVAMFAVMLGLGRSLYAKFGSNISAILFVSGIGSTVCYAVAAFTGIPILGLISCAMAGLCTSMMWPGSLMVASDQMPTGGVFLYAMMAAGGDLGAAVGPQLVGVVTDAVAGTPGMIDLATRLGFTPDQLGMKLGMLVGTVFPLIATVVYFIIWRNNRKSTRENATE